RDPPRRGGAIDRIARGADRQCRANRASDRRARLQPGLARCADPGRAGGRAGRSRRRGHARPPCSTPRAGSRRHHGDEPRPRATGLPAATVAGAAALAGLAGLRPVAAAAAGAGAARHGLSRYAAARRAGADAMNAAIGEVAPRRRAAALALARAGFSVALLEARAPRPWCADAEVDLRVVGLAPSSIALLDDMDVWTSIRQARASAYRRMHVWDDASGASIDFDAAAEGRDLLGCIVENSLVQWTLWQALETAGVRRLCPAEVTAFEARDDRIQLQLADGATLSAAVLVAADGAASPLRQLAGIGTRGRDYAQRAVVAHVDTERAHEDTAWQRFLPGGPLALLPLAD